MNNKNRINMRLQMNMRSIQKAAMSNQLEACEHCVFVEFNDVKSANTGENLE